MGSSTSDIKWHQAIFLANALLHFDNALYGYLVPIMAPICFPQQDLVMQLILGYSFLGMAFLAKPLGFFLFSHVARNAGADRALRYTLLGASIGLLLIASLPNTLQGSAGGILWLLAARICIESCAAGQQMIAKVALLSNPNSMQEAKKYASYYEQSGMAGIILAAMISACVGRMGDLIDAWRLPFALAAMITLCTLAFLRFRPMLSEDVATYKFPWKREGSIFLRSGLSMKAIIRMMLVTGFSYVTYTIPFMFMNSFVPMITTINRVDMMDQVAIWMIIDLLLLRWIGKTCRKYDHNNLMAVSSGLLALSIIPLFWWMSNASMGYVIFVRYWIILGGVFFSCFLNLWIIQQAPLHTTPYPIVGLVMELGKACIGKSAPAICLYLFHLSDSPMAPACYLAFLAFLAALIMADSASDN